MKSLRTFFLGILCSVVPLGAGVCATYTPGMTAYATVSLTSESFVSYEWSHSGGLTAGKWDDGAAVANVVATVVQGTDSQRPAIRWNQQFYRQTVVAGQPDLADITTDTGGTMRLRLSCGDATADGSGKGWLTANKGPSMSCAITAGQTATVSVGVYTVSLEGSVYSP